MLVDRQAFEERRTSVKISRGISGIGIYVSVRGKDVGKQHGNSARGKIGRPPAHTSGSESFSEGYRINQNNKQQ